MRKTAFFSGRVAADNVSFTQRDKHNAICLRPWGQLWDNIVVDYGEDILPNYYKSWYLPLVNAGKPIPEKMNVE